MRAGRLQHTFLCSFDMHVLRRSRISTVSSCKGKKVAVLTGLPISAQHNVRLHSQVDVMQLRAPSASRGDRNSEGDIPAFSLF